MRKEREVDLEALEEERVCSNCKLIKIRFSGTVFNKVSALPKLAGPQFRRKQQIPCSNVIFHTQARN